LTPSTKSASTLLQAGELTAYEFQRGIKRDKTHYAELKNYKYVNTRNRGFVCYCIDAPSQFVIDGNYVPVTATEVFAERCRASCMPKHTDNGKYLASGYVMHNPSKRSGQNMPIVKQLHNSQVKACLNISLVHNILVTGVGPLMLLCYIGKSR
jgi:hypothetical protein